MGQPDLWDGYPTTSVHLTLSYHHELAAWQAGYTILTDYGGGETSRRGSASMEFGPSDTYTEVGWWLAGLTKLLRSMETATVPWPQAD